MSLWTMAIRGATLPRRAGWIAELGGARLAPAQGGVATVIAALVAFWRFRRRQPAGPPEPGARP